MAIEYKKKAAFLRDTVSVEDADGLLDWLQKNPQGKVDLASCTHLHAAILQVLMASNALVSHWPKDVDLRAWLESVLNFKRG